MFNEKKFRLIYNEFLESGLTVRDYCVNQQMNEAKFYYWQNKLKGQLPPKRGFVLVVFENRQPASQIPAAMQGRTEPYPHPASLGKTISCEISYPNGVLVKLDGLPDVQMFRSLLVLTRR